MLCVVAPTIGVLGTLRVVQGLGVAATSVVAMAVVRDLFSGSAFARLFSRLMLVMGLAPILAPTLGSAVLEATNWRGVFVVLAGFGVLLTLTALVALRETLPPERRRRGGVADTVRTYRALLRDRVFVGMVLVAGFAMAALFSYVAGSSLRLPGPVRPGRAAVRHRVRRRRGRPDRGHPAQRPAAPPLHAAAGAGRPR